MKIKNKRTIYIKLIDVACTFTIIGSCFAIYGIASNVELNLKNWFYIMFIIIMMFTFIMSMQIYRQLRYFEHKYKIE